jgi:hypothetical protein
MTETSRDAVRSDLLHLLLTNKGERLYLPDFGSDLKKYIFEPNDKITQDEIKDNLNQTIKEYLPNLQINKVVFENMDIEESIKVIISFTITEGVFNSQDTVEITF